MSVLCLLTASRARADEYYVAEMWAKDCKVNSGDPNSVQEVDHWVIGSRRNGKFVEGLNYDSAAEAVRALKKYQQERKQ